MQESNWIETINEENKTGEISINIENYRNIRKKIKFKFIKGGITIIVGKNNVGKTNILDYIYERGERWNGFSDDAYKKNQKGNYLHKHLPLFFGNNKPIFFEKHEKILSLIREDNRPFFAPSNAIVIKELNIGYFYKLYYLDLKTFFGFLDSEFEGDETPKKIKIGGCRLKYAENYDEQTLGRKDGAKSLIWKENIVEKEDSWKIKYSGDSTESIDKLRDKETNSINYRAFNESMDKFHKIANIGSGHLKFQKIKTLMNSLNNNFESSPGEICIPILLIDELELLLHPPLVNTVSNLVKELKENNITTICSTHSPSLLSQFSYEDGVAFAVAKSEEDKRKKFLLGEITYFWDVVKEIKTDIEKVWKSYCNCLKSQINNDNEFYHNHWKSLLNEHTLRVFFAERVLFVEGISDYILFASGLLQKHIPELRKVEIIPIFAKSNYVFFKELSKKLCLDYWFLLDMDKHCINEEKFPEIMNWEEAENFSANENNLSKCSSEELHTNFWYRHRGELKKISEIKEEKIVHSKFSRITWFPKNMEDFLFPEGKKGGFWGKHHRKEARIVGNISLEDFIQERFENLKEELKEAIRWIEEKKRWDYLFFNNERKKLT